MSLVFSFFAFAFFFCFLRYSSFATALMSWCVLNTTHQRYVFIFGHIWLAVLATNTFDRTLFVFHPFFGSHTLTKHIFALRYCRHEVDFDSVVKWQRLNWDHASRAAGGGSKRLYSANTHLCHTLPKFCSFRKSQRLGSIKHWAPLLFAATARPSIGSPSPKIAPQWNIPISTKWQFGWLTPVLDASVSSFGAQSYENKNSM